MSLKLNCCIYVVMIVVNIVCNATPTRNNKDAVGFPENEENPDLKNKDDRKPVFLPSMCPENELYYPGDQKDDWICDCRPAYIYHPATDACWAAWRRGPCPEKQFLVLPANSVLPTCVPNPCEDDHVPWGSGCEQFGSTKPCTHLFPAMAAVGVNATTLVIECLTLTVETRFSEPVNSTCGPGCRRSINGGCSLY